MDQFATSRTLAARPAPGRRGPMNGPSPPHSEHGSVWARLMTAAQSVPAAVPVQPGPEDRRVGLPAGPVPIQAGREPPDLAVGRVVARVPWIAGVQQAAVGTDEEESA